MRFDELIMILESISLLMDRVVEGALFKYSDSELSESRVNYGSGVFVGRT